MVVVAAACAAAGTFEVHRYGEKRRDNAALVANIGAAAVPLTPRVVPLVGHGAAPDATAVRYRTVTATGTYLPTQQYVGNQQQGGHRGFWVLSPLNTATGTVLL